MAAGGGLAPSPMHADDGAIVMHGYPSLVGGRRTGDSRFIRCAQNDDTKGVGGYGGVTHACLATCSGVVKSCGGADQGFEGWFVEGFVFVDVDGAAGVAFEAGVEEVGGVV